MNRLVALLIVIVLSLASGVKAQTQPGPNEVLSANRRFSAEFSLDDPSKPLLTVYQWENETKSVSWTRTLPPDENGSGMITPMLVANDGRYVLRSEENLGQGAPLLQLFRQKGEIVSVTDDQVFDVAGPNLDTEPAEILRDGRALSILLEDQTPPIYAMWLDPAETWIVLALDAGKLLKPSGALANRLEAEGLARARARVQDHQPGMIRRLLQPVRRAAAEIPGFQRMAPPDGGLSSETSAAYRFLAARRLPEDKPYIEKLLSYKIEGIMYAGEGMDGPGQSARITLYSPERQLGDKLIARWNDPASLPEAQDYWSTQTQLFGEISGVVRLPFSAAQGTVRLLLIPAHIRTNSWEGNDQVIALESAVGGPGGGPFMMAGAGPANQPDVSEIRFAFATLSPGDYRIKALFDPRAAARGQRSSTASRPASGHYESEESGVLKVNAGAAVRQQIILCTNQAGPLDADLAAAEKRRQTHPPEYSAVTEALERTGPPARFSVSIASWALRTNLSSGRLYATRLRLQEVNRFPWGRAAKGVQIRYVDRDHKQNDYNVQYETTLIDEHGCRFRSGTGSGGGKILDAFFTTFPYNSRTFRLEIKRTPLNVNPGPRGMPEAELAFSVDLTNRFAAQAAALQGSRLPARRDFGSLAIEVKSLSDPGSRQPGTPVIHFTQGGKPDWSWRVEGFSFEDAWGNSSSSPQDFCRQEKNLKLKVRFLRDFELGNFDPDETWEIPIAQIPKPGTVERLNLRQELAGIGIEILALGGPGEFTFKNGRATAQSERIPFERPPRNVYDGVYFPGRSDLQNRDAKIFYTHAGSPFGFAGNYRNDEDQLVARVPFVVFRVTRAPADAQFVLREQIEQAEHDRRYNPMPMRRNSETATRYAALPFRSGETSRRLTFLGQQIREAEFVIAVDNSSNELPPEN